MSQGRNSTLDIIKLLASYMVVFIHVLFYGKIGTLFDILARFAVPLFFTISGYYSKNITEKQIMKRIYHIFRLLIIAVTVYTLKQIYPYMINMDMQGMVQYFSGLFNLKSVLKLIVLNVPFYAVHLWYLFALIYVYAAYYFVTILNVQKKIIFLGSLLLLLMHLFLAEGLSACKIVVPIPIVRNFALMGIPFFGIGLLVNTYRYKLCEVSDRVILISFLIGIVATLLSRWFLGKNELYTGSLFILFSLVIIFVKYPNIKVPSGLLSLAGCNTYIYIFHPMVSDVIKRIYSIFSFNYNSSIALRMVHPIIVCVFTSLLAYIINNMIRWRDKRHRKAVA